MTIVETFPLRGLFILTIIVVVLFTVFVQGITIKPLVIFLRIKTKEVGEPSIFQEVNHRVVNHLASGIDAMAGPLMAAAHNKQGGAWRVDLANDQLLVAISRPLPSLRSLDPEI